MKQETNNEIDLLLRRLSRRQGVPMSEADLRRIDSDHLDADELSSYAENVLPAVARARYTEHIVACSSCRELVVQLSASVPVVTRKEIRTETDPSGLKKVLLSLFSQPVLRYAAPVLGLIVAGAIGFAMLRSRNASDGHIVQLERPVQQAPNMAPTDDLKRTHDSPAPAESQSSAGKPVISADTQKEAAAQPTADPATPAERSDRVEPKADAQVQETERQTVASAAPAPPPQKPEPTIDEMRVEVEGRKANVESRTGTTTEVAKQRSTETFRDQDKKAEETAAPQASTKGKTSGNTPQRGQSTSSLRVAEDREKDDEGGAIRTAGGRRFRKQSGTWVDTAHNSGSEVINVARGSEQYRALVADEPTIKTIADQLDGPIIVVWKGRTYRIR